MRTIEHGKHKVELFDSAEMMPMKRYQRFNKFLMIDNEVGSDFTDFNKRTAKAIELLKKGLMDDAVRELDNRRQMVYNAFMEYSPKGRAFAILVHSIDGEVFTDYSKGGLDKVIDKLEQIGLSYMLTDEAVREVKKKLETELKLYFPSEFKNNDKIEYNIELLKLMKLELDQIINDTEEKGIEETEKRILQMDLPKTWNVNHKGNMEVEMEAEFAKFMFAVSEHTKEDMDTITVFKFYALLGYIKEKNPKNN